MPLRHYQPAVESDTNAPPTPLPSSKTILETLQLLCEANTDAYATAHRRSTPLIGPRPGSRAESFIKASGREHGPEPLTWFHSRAVPGFTLERLSRSLRHPNWSFDEGSSLMAAGLMVRWSEATGVPLTALMMHRLFLACALVVAKMHHDVYPRNVDYAAATGIQLTELNRLETAVVEGVEWRCTVSAADVCEMAAGLERLMADDSDDEADQTSDSWLLPTAAATIPSAGIAKTHRCGGASCLSSDSHAATTTANGYLPSDVSVRSPDELLAEASPDTTVAAPTRPGTKLRGGLPLLFADRPSVPVVTSFALR